MMLAFRVVLCVMAVFGVLKSMVDKTERDSAVTVIIIGIAVSALLISFRMV